ncbi:MAG: DNRLRE domain-containing protein, partial [Anaerolineae bacterium]|nr:DNRLRE domain-containing protein [Anaerolineae bacterium]
LQLQAKGTWVSFDVTELVRYWATHPGENFGLVIKGSASGPSVAYTFASLDYPVPEARPRLLVRYRGPAPSPTPTLTVTPSPTPGPLPSVLVLSVEADADMNSWAPENNYGYNALLPLRTFGYKRPIFRFNLSSLPKEAKVERALFRARTVGSEGAAITVEVVGLARPWSEHQVTWLSPATGQQWASPGADAPGIDRLSEPADTITITGGERWWEWDVTSLVKAWASGQLPNYGFMLVSRDTALHREINVASQGYGYPAQLIIEYTAPPSPQAYTLHLYKGLNMVSLPVCPQETSIETLLHPIADKLIRVWAFDAADTSDPWKLYEPGGNENDLTELSPEQGYWLEMADEAILTVIGLPCATRSIPLHTGWNFVGYPRLAERGMASITNTANGAVELVWHYAAQDTADPWKRYSPSIPPWANDLSTFSPGKGYWILANRDSELLLP